MNSHYVRSTAVELFNYSPIIERGPFRLPNDAKIAVWFGINIEHYTPNKPAMSLAPFTAQLVPDPLNYGWRDYGPRVGVWRLSDIFSEHDITPSAITNSEVITQYPQIIDHGLEKGWAFAGHGVNNSDWHNGIPIDEEVALIESIQTSFKSRGIDLKGWLGPALTSTENTVEVLAQQGFTYSLDWANDDLPYWFNLENQRLLSIPYSSEVNDIPAFAIHHQTGEQFGQALRDQFDVLYAEGETSPRVMGVGLHPFLVGQPFRAKYLAEALAYMKEHEGVWFATSDEIADWAFAHGDNL